MEKKLWLVLTIIIGAVAVLILIKSSSSNQQSTLSPQETNLTPQGEKIPIQGREHIGIGGSHPPYNSNPPTSGWHYEKPAAWGFYDNPLPDEQIVHNLEHGGIWISYKDINEQTKQKLQQLAQKYNQAVIITPRPKNDTPIALASWGRLLKLEKFNQDAIEKFIKTNINNSPEPLASLEKVKVVRGGLAPEAHFTLSNGNDAHLSDFRNKKVMLWLLATWCPSCIAGAQILQESNNKLTDLTIIALKTYGNAGYPGPSIEAFAKQNAPATLSASNWSWGNLSSESTKIYNPKNFPDIYFLIDKNGILKDIDGAPAATINKIIDFANE